MEIQVFWVDAFSHKPFAGNPAAVCLMSHGLDERWMQQVAREMNLSETAFLLRDKDGFSLRWFTPETEVELCGHATLACAHVLYCCGIIAKSEAVRFYTRSGLLTANYVDGWIYLDFPAEPPWQADLPDGIIQSLGVCPLFTGQNRLDYLVVVESEEMVLQAKPNFALLAQSSDRGIILTSKATNTAYDIVSRYFDPAEGIDEDPVTGSAHCCLGPYWKSQLGKEVLLAYQASARGGLLQVSIKDKRVILAGQAAMLWQGKWCEGGNSIEG